MSIRIFFALCTLAFAPALLVGCNLQPKGQTQDDRPAPSARALALAEEGQRLKSEGFTAQALNRFNQAVEQNPALTRAHLGIGTIYREMARYEQADAAYRKAVISDPNDFDARYFLGLTNQLQGKLKQAIASYERALRIDPASDMANRDMASAMLQVGRPGDAIRYARRAVDLNPQSAAGWANLGAAYSLVGEYRAAVEAYRQTLELGEPEQPVLIGLADAHLKLGNYQRAENVLRQVLRSSDSALAQERMGLALFKQRKYEQAIEAYRVAQAKNPNDTAALNGLGVSHMAIYLRDGEEDEKRRMKALGLWRKSLSLRPDQGFLIDLIARYTKE